MHIPVRPGQAKPYILSGNGGRPFVIIGALNWGSVGFFAFDCVAFICGGQLAALSRIIYALVGIAGLWCITLLFRERDSEE